MNFRFYPFNYCRGLLVLALIFLTSCSAAFSFEPSPSVSKKDLETSNKQLTDAIMNLHTRLQKLESQFPKEQKTK